MEAIEVQQKGQNMSISEFVEKRTSPQLAGAVSIAALRRDYAAAVGRAVSRCEFLCALAASGYSIVSPVGRPSYLVGRAMAQPAA